jgi:hypothetical protein
MAHLEQHEDHFWYENHIEQQWLQLRDGWDGQTFHEQH